MSEQGPHMSSGMPTPYVVRRDRALGSLVRRHTHLYSTRTAEGFSATLQESGEEVLLWLLRFPFAAGTEDDQRFIERIHSLSSFFPKGCIHSFGVDEKGSVFAALRFPALDPVSKLGMPLTQRLITWEGIVRLVSEIHLQGICLGDISEDSFVWHPERGPQLLGLMGSFASAGAATAMLPPPATVHYLAPEQKGIFANEPGFDVFALGVFAYRLFTRAYPYGSPRGADGTPSRAPISPEVLEPAVPEWVEPVLGVALQAEPERRFRDATALLEAIETQGASIDSSLHKSIWAGQTADISEKIIEVARNSEVLQVDYESVETGFSFSKLCRLWERRPQWLQLGGYSLIGAGFALLLFAVFTYFGNTRIEPYSEAHRSYVPPELESQLAVISDRALALRRRKEAVAALAGVENQFTYPILATLIQGANDESIRAAALQDLSQSIQRAGMPRVANVFRSHLPIESLRRTLETGADPFLSLVRSADPMQAMEARLLALERAYRNAPVSTLKVAAALALDGGSASQVQTLRRLLALDPNTLCSSAQVCEPRDRVPTLLPRLDLSALLLSNTATTMFWSADLVEHVWVQTPQSQAYVLEYFFRENTSALDAIVRVGLEQGGISPLGAVIVRYFEFPGGLEDQAVAVSLLRSIVGVVNEEDLYRFRRWRAEGAASMLVAIAGILAERGHRSAIDVFDIANEKSSKEVAEKALLEFVRTEAWNERAKLITPTAVILYSELFEMDMLATAFDSFEPYSTRNFFNTLLKTENPKSIRLALLRFGSQLPSSQIIPVLRNPDPSVRKEAIRALAGRNDLSVLQGILAAYDAERDASVRKVYHQLHWVTKGR